MKFSLANTAEFYSIQSYDSSGIIVSSPHNTANTALQTQRFEKSIFICSTQMIESFPVSNIAELSASNCHALFDLNERLKLDVLLIGGDTFPALLSLDLQQIFIEHGIGVECMSVGAACRTYNMLLNESRSVGVLLLM